MKIIKSFNVKPNLPERLKPLENLSRNLWYGWQPELIALFQRLDRELWEQSNHNPTYVLGHIDQENLERAARDEGFLAHMDRMVEEFERYMGKPAAPDGVKVAYFSAEYGLAESLKLYSGGLGILSGDYLKSASDLNIPLVGIGLLYQEGYFHQAVDLEGWQIESPSDTDFINMPLHLMKQPDGRPLMIDVTLRGQKVYAKIWCLKVGRTPLYLLDNNVEENPPEHRRVAAQLYGGSVETRLQQEILLGIGGVRALQALGIEPTVYHMNEGHSAFAGLERIRILREQRGLSFDEAQMAVFSTNIFTTHTPVPAGIDIFDENLMEAYFSDYIPLLGISMPVLLALGRVNPWDKAEPFNMAVLAIRLSAHVNGVSRLHGEVSRRMWRGIWSELPEQDIPITHITNGVHIPSWISRDMSTLYDRYLGPHWYEDPDNLKVWERVDQIPDSELWRTHERRRERLVAFCRMRLQRQLEQRGAPWSEIAAAKEVLHPAAMTIGFARRFAAYKRATLLLRDLNRLERILNDDKRPVQVIFAGKAHPKDQEGKALIQQIVRVARQERFRNKIVFIENYDMNVARYLVQGADVWLNTPRRPMEACGTSGMKATANGALNVSILDGWWCEGYRVDNGWAIGEVEEFADAEHQDEVESRSLYNILEKDVIPLFFNRGPDGLPRGWIARMKASMRGLCPVFNTHRMIQEYYDRFYLKGSRRWEELQREEMKGARALAEWKRKMMLKWNEIEIREIRVDPAEEFVIGSNIEVFADIFLGEITPEDVVVELYCGEAAPNEPFAARKLIAARCVGADQNGTYRYQGAIPCDRTGRFNVALRILPFHPLLDNPFTMNLIKWAS